MSVHFPADLRYTPPDGGHSFCSLPGSIQYTANGQVTVPGGPTAPDISFLHVPTGFCVHYFGNVGNARQLRFAPGGELFVASPTMGTTSGGPNGKASIVVLPDDDQDGVTDAQLTYLNNLPSTQGLLFAGNYFYYQDGINIMRVPYQKGDRAPSGSSITFATINVYTSGLHWPKMLDIADDGATIYISNGGDQGDSCNVPWPFHGGILKVDATSAPGTAPAQVAKGFRNPIALRCHSGFGQCYAVELARDYSATMAGREKVVPIRQGDDWGFPCCATKDTPYSDLTLPNGACSNVASESAAFVIGETPFGLDFEYGNWPAPWNKNLFVVVHGAYGSWSGARVVGIPTDPNTGAPINSSNLPGQQGGMTDFATGWDDGTRTHGRPTAITFASDGRMFLSNDQNGDIVWIAPIGL